MDAAQISQNQQKSRITLRATPGARKQRKRVGRGAGSTVGSTCGRGDKGQNSRSGGGVRPGFEGGQMPLKRRLPKRGFSSMSTNASAEVRLWELNQFEDQIVDLALLKEKGIVPSAAARAKVILAGKLEKPVSLKGIRVSSGARAAIEAANGQIEE